MCTVSYATRPHPDEHRSVFVVAVGDDVHVISARGRGLHLEATALLRALALALKSGRAIDHVTASPDLYDVVTGARPAPAGDDRVVENIRRFLAAHPRDLRPGPAPAHLVALLAEQTSVPEFSGVDADAIEWARSVRATVVYTDGSANGDEYLGAWAWYVDETRYAAGPVPHLAISLTAERYAVAQALKQVDGPILVVTDAWDLTVSRDVYVEAQGVIDELDELIASRGADVRITYVKGHDDCLGNIAADQIASRARDQHVQHVRANPARVGEHRKQVEQLRDATAEHRAAQEVKRAWFSQRAFEIISVEHPNWHDLPAPERTRLGREITLRMREEYNAEHPNEVPDSPVEGEFEAELEANASRALPAC